MQEYYCSIDSKFIYTKSSLNRLVIIPSCKQFYNYEKRARNSYLKFMHPRQSVLEGSIVGKTTV